MNMTMNIGHADTRHCFITNHQGYDIAVLKRLSEEMPDLPIQNRISDEQWQTILDAIDTVVKNLNPES